MSTCSISPLVPHASKISVLSTLTLFFFDSILVSFRVETQMMLFVVSRSYKSFVCVHVCVCMYAHVRTHAHGCQKGASEALEVKLQAIVSHSTWVLGIKF